MNIQRFENTFFKMLELVSSCRDQINYTSVSIGNSKDYYGREALNRIYKSFIEYYLTDYRQEGFDQIATFKESCLKIDGTSNEYSNLYIKHGDSLGQYYRVIYNILKLIDSSNFIEDKYIYSKLLRAQLSRFELSLLFYNCLSTYGSEKMSPLIKEYKILKHLEIDTLPQQHLLLWEQFKAA